MIPAVVAVSCLSLRPSGASRNADESGARPAAKDMARTLGRRLPGRLATAPGSHRNGRFEGADQGPVGAAADHPVFPDTGLRPTATGVTNAVHEALHDPTLLASAA